MRNEVVLATGYPELQARRLVAHVLAVEPETRIVLIVPSATRTMAEEHVARLANDASRIEILEGEASALDMGLSGAELRLLGRRVTRIHHVAHEAHARTDRRTAERINVQGAVEAVAVARACGELTCLVHHSTALVSGDRAGVVLEDELDEGQGFHSAVQESRMRAEIVMRRAMRDVPIAVVRPTMMVGDSDTGEADRLDGPYLLALMLLGLPGDMAIPLPTGSDNPFDVVPVDFVVRAAHHLSRQPDAVGRTFHLASPEGLTAQQVFDSIARAGNRRTSRSLLPAQLAAALSRAPGLARLLQEPGALVQQLSTSARYDTRNADRMLAGTGIVCPPLESYVATLVATVQERLRDRQPGTGSVDPEA